MTLFSWIYMLAVWAVILTLNVFCFYKVFQKPKIEPIEEEQDGEVSFK